MLYAEGPNLSEEIRGVTDTQSVSSKAGAIASLSFLQFFFFRQRFSIFSGRKENKPRRLIHLIKLTSRHVIITGTHYCMFLS